MAKLTLNPVQSGFYSTTLLNQNFSDIEAAIENTLSRDGSTPNHMNAPLDMNSNDILNVDRINATSLVLGGELVLAKEPLFTAISASQVSFYQAEPESINRTSLEKMRESKTSNDYQTLQDGVNAAAGAELEILPGTISVPFVSVPANTSLKGSNSRNTTIQRTGTGNLVSLTTGNDVGLSGITLNMDRTATGADGHGVASSKEGLRLRDLVVRDFGSSAGGGGAGVLTYGTGNRDNRLTDSTFYGNTGVTTSYGWIFEGNQCSFANALYARDIKTYAHELKNQANYNALSDLIAEGAGAALAYGRDTGIGPSKNVAVNIVSRACNIGFLVGYGNNNIISGLLHDNTGASGGSSHVARFENSNGNALFGALGVGSFTNTIRYDGNRNYAQIASHDTSGSIVSLLAGASANATEIAHPGTRTSILSAIDDNSGNSLRSANSNPVWCHATGERVGSLSGVFRDKLGQSNALANSRHYWRNESDQYAVQSYMTPGNAGDNVGIAYAIPGSSTYASVIYSKASSASGDYWNIGVANVNVARFYTTVFRPVTDDAISLGNTAGRWSVVYATTGTINTSDAREKQQIRPVSESEHAVAIRLKSMIRTFKWNNSVEQKGEDARIHFGLIAQEVKEAFEAEGLDAMKYGTLCYDEWDDEYEPVMAKREINGSIEEYDTGEKRLVRAAGNRYGVRYDQLFALIISAM